jgi:hypothetical protein
MAEFAQEIAAEQSGPVRPRKLTPRQRAVMKAREEIRHELLYTPALDHMNEIEQDPVFRDLGAAGKWAWIDQSRAASTRRSMLHTQYRELCGVREAELREKFGTWPVPEGRIQADVRQALDAKLAELDIAKDGVNG